jgi:hypothetical protein
MECKDETGSTYLIAEDDQDTGRRKELLYEVLGPVFFGNQSANSEAELAELFARRYGIDVSRDFMEGDEHYEEYCEARQAISEGLSIYAGEIVFDDTAMAELADRLWNELEQKNGGRFRRINTMLEE